MSDEFDAELGIRTAQKLVHKTAMDAGWYNNPATGQPVERNVGEVIALMHSELSEALEAYRKDLMDDKLPHRPGIEVEFADCIIRILDTAAALNLDVAGAIFEKNRYNKTRADHSLAARAAKGGRSFDATRLFLHPSNAKRAACMKRHVVIMGEPGQWKPFNRFAMMKHFGCDKIQEVDQTDYMNLTIEEQARLYNIPTLFLTNETVQPNGRLFALWNFEEALREIT